jgi:hypothetical protein
MNQYSINSHFVCTNPDRTVVYKSAKTTLVVKTCQHQGKWFAGYEFEEQTRGSMSPVNIVGMPSNSKSEAEIYAIGILTRKYSPSEPQCQKAIDEFLQRNKQLTLF